MPYSICHPSVHGFKPLCPAPHAPGGDTRPIDSEPCLHTGYRSPREEALAGIGVIAIPRLRPDLGRLLYDAPGARSLQPSHCRLVDGLDARRAAGARRTERDAAGPKAAGGYRRTVEQVGAIELGVWQGRRRPCSSKLAVRNISRKRLLWGQIPEPLPRPGKTRRPLRSSLRVPVLIDILREPGIVSEALRGKRTASGS